MTYSEKNLDILSTTYLMWTALHWTLTSMVGRWLQTAKSYGMCIDILLKKGLRLEWMMWTLNKGLDLIIYICACSCMCVRGREWMSKGERWRGMSWVWPKCQGNSFYSPVNMRKVSINMFWVIGLTIVCPWVVQSIWNIVQKCLGGNHNCMHIV